MGPGAGHYGGNISASGSPDELSKKNLTLTAQYLNGVKRIPIPKKYRTIDPKKLISIIGATANNLKKINVNIPLGLFTVVTGVSGSGKSSLIIDVLQKRLSALRRARGAL